MCFQLRHLQNQLRIQVALNSARRARIQKRAVEYLGYQEYEQLMGELNKQIEAIYVRRHVRTVRRRAATTTLATAVCIECALLIAAAPFAWPPRRPPQRTGKRGRRGLRLKPMSDADRSLLETARRLSERLAAVFPPEKFQSPTTSVFDSFEGSPNPVPNALLDSVVYPSKTVPHPVIQSVMAGTTPTYGPSPALGAVGSADAVGSPAGGWHGGYGAHGSDPYGSPSTSGRSTPAPTGAGDLAAGGGAGGVKKKKSGSSGRPKSVKVIPPSAYGNSY